MAYYPFGGTTYNLSSSISSTATSITLASFLEPVTSTPYTMALLNTDIAYGTIAPKTTSSEFISFTGITQNSDGTATLTGVTRGLAKKYPFTTDSSYKLPHSGQTQFIISDAPQVFEKFVTNTNDETVAGIKTFSSSPIVPTPTTATQAANKSYIDGIAIAGSPDSTTTTKGIGKVSVAPASATSPIFVGDNDNRVSPVSLATVTAGRVAALAGDNTDIAVGAGNLYVTQTGLQKAAEVYAADSGSANVIAVALSPVPTSYAAGMIVRVKVAAATTTATTINVNALGAKTVKKYAAGVQSDLTTNDIIANQTVTLIYDGTNFILQGAGANTQTSGTAYTNGFVSFDTSTTAATVISHGLGKTPKLVRFTALMGNPAGAFQPSSFGVYNGTTNTVVYRYSTNAGATTGAVLGDNTNCIHLEPDQSGGSDKTVATATFDSSNITLSWSKSSSPGPTGTAYIMWEAQG